MKLHMFMYGLCAFALLPLTMSLSGTCIGVCITINIKSASVSCIGSGSANCSATVNAIGEREVIDVSQYKVTDFGVIDKPKEVLFDLPAVRTAYNEPVKPLIYSFTPTQGELAGTKIYVAISDIIPKLGSRYQGRDVYHFFRLLEGQKPNQWIDAGNLNFILDGTNPNSIPKQWGALIQPDGTWTISYTDAAGEQTVNFAFGKK